MSFQTGQTSVDIQNTNADIFYKIWELFWLLDSNTITTFKAQKGRRNWCFYVEVIFVFLAS